MESHHALASWAGPNRVLDGIADRLAAVGFTIDPSVESASGRFDLVAWRDAALAPATPNLVTVQSRTTMTTRDLPSAYASAVGCLREWRPSGSFSHGRPRFMFVPVLVLPAVDELLAKAVQRQRGPHEFGREVSFPVIVNGTTGEAHYWPRTPLIGAVFYPGFRRLVRECLVAADTAV